MLEGRNISEDYAKTRINGGRRPYAINFNGNNGPVLKILNDFGVYVDDPNASSITQRRGVGSQQTSRQNPNKDILITSLHNAHLRADPNARSEDPRIPDGTNIMPDRIILRDEDPRERAFFQTVFEQVQAGRVTYKEFKRGAYGAVGISPTLRIDGEEYTLPGICIKYFNYAYPFDDKAWEDFLKRATNKEPDTSKWNLSGVTAVGSYMALRYLEEAGKPVPKVYLASSEILIQQFIPGETIGDIRFKHGVYEELKAKGALGNDDTCIDRLHDFADEEVPVIAKEAQAIIGSQRGSYWGADFTAYDIHEGNILIPLKMQPDGTEVLANPYEEYYIIDPLR